MSFKTRLFNKRNQPSLVSDPTNCRPGIHVSYNKETGNLDGLPTPWRRLIYNVFTEDEEKQDSEDAEKDLEKYNVAEDLRTIPDNLPCNSEDFELKPNMCKVPSCENILYEKDSPNNPYEELKKICNLKNPKERYEMIKMAGVGASGEVFIAVDKASNQQQIAVKTIDMRKNNPLYILSEIEVMKKFNHPNLVNFLDAYLLKEEHCLWVIMEYMSGGTLTDILVTVMNEPQMAYVCREVLKAISFLHSNGVIHRDIKSDNILLGMAGEVKVSDFGFAANVQGNQKRQTVVGTSFWMAPEIAKRKNYCKKVDIWAIGIMLIEMIDEIPPYMDETDTRNSKVLELIGKNSRPNVKQPEKLSLNLKSFLDRCLVIEVDNRATADELLSHPFLENCCESMDIVQKIAKAKNESKSEH